MPAEAGELRDLSDEELELRLGALFKCERGKAEDGMSAQATTFKNSNCGGQIKVTQKSAVVNLLNHSTREVSTSAYRFQP